MKEADVAHKLPNTFVDISDYPVAHFAVGPKQQVPFPTIFAHVNCTHSHACHCEARAAGCIGTLQGGVQLLTKAINFSSKMTGTSL